MDKSDYVDRYRNSYDGTIKPDNRDEEEFWNWFEDNICEIKFIDGTQHKIPPFLIDKSDLLCYSIGIKTSLKQKKSEYYEGFYINKRGCYIGHGFNVINGQVQDNKYLLFKGTENEFYPERYFGIRIDKEFLAEFLNVSGIKINSIISRRLLLAYFYKMKGVGDYLTYTGID